MENQSGYYVPSPVRPPSNNLGRGCAWGTVGLGLGCILPQLLGFLAVIAFAIFAIIFYNSHEPKVKRTPAGISITNTSGDKLTKVKVTLGVEFVRKPDETAEFQTTIPQIGPHQTTLVNYSQFKAKSGHSLNTKQFTVDSYKMSVNSEGTISEYGSDF